MKKVDVVIIGAGPGGLRCGQMLAAGGASVLIIERKPIIGKKVCAGGITWSGLIERLPDRLIERSFSSQRITTARQNVQITSAHPIIATVNRQNLGKYMADEAISDGAEIVFPAFVKTIDKKKLSYTQNNKTYTVGFDYLIGADGSLSKVRRYLGLSNKMLGTGINFTLPCSSEEMEWHFDAENFGSGYSWIFPHRKTTSIGFYLSKLQKNLSDCNKCLSQWAEKKGFLLDGVKVEAEKICYDYQGWNFGKNLLVGDAAGLASPLTGEGIFPAFISAESAAETILKQNYSPVELNKLINKHHKHAIMVKLAIRKKLYASILSELAVFLLRFKIISFEKFEMA